MAWLVEAATIRAVSIPLEGESVATLKSVVSLILVEVNAKKYLLTKLGIGSN
jgi:hypothetical protein